VIDPRIFMLERRRRGGIFGRDLDLAAMERFLDSASMWPSAIVIEGEAGTGKQRCASRRSSREVISCCSTGGRHR
jgi:DNA-binding NtrC family response regulator